MPSLLTGKVLVAAPELLDPNFARAVVLIIHHDENGALGLILNRPLETTVAEAWTQVSSVPYPNNDPLFHGGPCDGPLLVLHQTPQHAQIESEIDTTADGAPGGAGVCLSQEADSVRALVSAAADPIKFFFGSSGWKASQLEEELHEGAWFIAPINAALIFSTPPNLWSQLLKQCRPTSIPVIDPRLIPPDPSVN
jgi:putative transcriptional regulator